MFWDWIICVCGLSVAFGGLAPSPFVLTYALPTGRLNLLPLKDDKMSIRFQTEQQ